LKDQYRVPLSACPSCGTQCDAASTTNESTQPVPGDISICVRCGELLKFGDDMRLMRLTHEERIEVEADPYVARVQAAWQRMQGHRGN
jgi:hypothetical protein